MGKNVAVFVDVANIFYAAKAAGVDIDYVTLLKAAVSGRDFVRAYAYTGLDPENENQRNFHSFLARHGYKVVSKDIRKYGDGKVKANLDIELVVDMMKTARNLDVAIVVSGDGDFAPAIRAVQEMGVRVEVISFRGNTSSDLIEVADIFTDITQIARVDRDSQRSGRRVAGDDEDLSMTEVPDKQTEGSGRRRRGRGGRGEREYAAAGNGQRGRGEAARVESGRPEVARGDSGRAGAGRRAPVRTGDSGRIVVLPGEKLSRAQGGGEEPEPIEVFAEDAVEGLEGAGVPEPLEAAEGGELVTAEAAEGGEEQAADGQYADGRRRRRRGGRGRGRGRARDLAETTADEVVAEEVEEAETPPLAPPAPRPNPFGSVWDSQIGMVGRPAELTPLPPDEDDYAEPEIPEYLLAERRRGRSGGGGGGRGRGGARSAYASAMERERFGRAGRYPEPARPMGQPGQGPRRRDERPPRQPQPQPQQQRRAPQQQQQRASSEPWSEVPPEIEEMLRAQLAARMTRPAEAAPEPGSGTVEPRDEAADQAAEPVAGVAAAPRGRGRGRRTAAQPVEVEATPATTPAAEPEVEATAAPARRGRGRRVAGTTASAGAAEAAEATGATAAAAPEPAAEAAPARTRGRRRVAAASDVAAEGAGSAGVTAAAPEAEAEAPKRRTTRRRTASADTAGAAATETGTGGAAEASAAAGTETAPKRRAPARRRTAGASNANESGTGGE